MCVQKGLNKKEEFMKKILVSLGLALFMLPQLVVARDFFLPYKSERICVKKSKSIVFRKVKFDILKVNGATENYQTFWFNGTHSKLKLDYSIPQHVVATCKSVGNDTYNFEWSIDGGTYGAILYHRTIRVECIACPGRPIRVPPRFRPPFRFFNPL